MKDFYYWNQEKELLEIQEKRRIQLARREVWLAKVGENIGCESRKADPFIRPAVILNKFMGGDLILIVFLTTQFKSSLKHFFIPLESTRFGGRKSFAMVNQIRVMSKKRLIRQCGEINADEYLEIKKRLQSFL